MHWCNHIGKQFSCKAKLVLATLTSELLDSTQEQGSADCVSGPSVKHCGFEGDTPARSPKRQ